MQGAGAALQGAEPFGEPPGARAEPFEAAGQPLGGVLELADPSFELLAAGRDPVEAAVDEAGDVAQAFGFVAGGGDRPGQGPRPPRPAAGARDPSRAASASSVARLAGPVEAAAPDLGHQRAQAELQGEAADGGLALRLGELLRALGEAAIAVARLLAAGRGPFEAAGEQAGAFLGPPGALFEQGAARRALGEAAAQPGDGAGGVAQAGAEAGEAADPVRPVAVRVSPSLRSGLVPLATGPGPITARMPGWSAIRRCQRLSRARRSGVVIGPSGAAATRTKGASHPGPTASSIVSAFWRASLEVGSSSTPGAAVVRARAGAASRISGIAIRSAAKPGRRSALEAVAATQERPRPGGRAAERAGVDPARRAGRGARAGRRRRRGR